MGGGGGGCKIEYCRINNKVAPTIATIIPTCIPCVYFSFVFIFRHYLEHFSICMNIRRCVVVLRNS